MSLHKSLVTKGKLVRQRNVFTRTERLEILKKDRRWKEGDSVFNLPKVKTAIKVKKAKVKKEAAEGAEGAAAAGAAPAAAAPAAGKGAAAAPAKGDAKAKDKGGKK
jgi:small basic protein (TIGR04137 family)